ncbi:MAG: autotransporter domain-containing protein [Pseudomonadota bacterium]
MSRCSGILIGSVAMTILPGLPVAGPDGCTVNGNVAECTGDQSAGILEGFDFDTPPVDTLIVDSPTAITPVDGNAAIDISGNDVTVGGADTIDITATLPGGIVVTGDRIVGINAGLGTDVTPFTGQGTITIDSTADIQSTGADFVQGISAFIVGDGTVTITSDGNVTANASDEGALGAALGGQVMGAGDVGITSTGTVSTTNVDGIGATIDAGNAIISQTGNINTAGTGADAISVDLGDGQFSITNTGNITTNGVGGNGILATHNGNGIVQNTGDITLSGTNSVGIALIEGAEAPTATFLSIDQEGDISANGANSAGVFVTATGGTFVDLRLDGDITATAVGVRVQIPDGFFQTFLTDSDIMGGTSAGIDVENVAGVENASAFIVLDGTSSIASANGVAISSAAGDTSVSNSGTIRGSVIFDPFGSNAFFNNVGSVFESGTAVQLGDGNRLTNFGTLSPFGQGTLGVSTLTGDLVMEEESTFSVDISDIGSDALSVDGFVFINGTIEVNATTAPGTFAVGDVFSVLDATDGIIGLFDTITDNLAGFELVPLRALDGSQLVVAVTDDGTFLAVGCSAAGGVITCGGDQSNGVTNQGLGADFATNAGTRLVVEGVSGPIGASNGLSAVDILLNRPDGFIVEVDSGNQGIATFASQAAGIEVRNIAGNIGIVSDGNIQTTGAASIGVVGFIEGDGDIDIDSSSDIATSSFQSSAIFAGTENGNITISSNGELQTNGSISSGIVAEVRALGDITITNDGAIEARNNSSSDAISAEIIDGGDISITSTGNLTSGGESVILAVIGDSDDDTGLSDGNITINSVGDISNAAGTFSGGIEAEIEGDGDIVVSSEGAITTDATFGDGILGFVEGDNGSVTITSVGAITSQRADGIFGLAGTESGSVSVTSTGNIFSSGAGIFGRGTDGVTIDSTGDIDASTILGGIFANARRFNFMDPTTPLGDVTITSVGNIRNSNDRIGNTVIGPAIYASAGEQVLGGPKVNVTISSTGDLRIDGGTGSAGRVDSPAAGIEVVLEGPADAVVSSNGSITSSGVNSPGFSVLYRDYGDRGGVDLSIPQGDVMISSDGDISTTGEESDAVRIINTGATTSTVNLLGGAVMAGTGDSAGVNFINGDETTGIVNVLGGSLQALSGVAVRGLGGNETINNSATISGSIELGGGINAFNNLFGGRFNSGPVVNLNGGALNNAGTLAPGASIGDTALDGALVLESTGTLEIELESTGATDTIDATGSIALDGILDVAAAIVGGVQFAADQTFDFLMSDTGITGTFDLIIHDLADFDFNFSITDVAGVEVGRLTVVDAGVVVPGACATNGTTTVCTGDLAGGVSSEGTAPDGQNFDSPPTATLVIRTLTADVTNTGTNASVTFNSDTAEGITLNVDTGDFAVSATGGDGIAAANTQGGGVDINVAGRVISTGSANGITATSDALGTEVSVTTTGQVEGGVHGIYASNEGTGLLEVDAGSVTGNLGDGIRIEAGAGVTSISSETTGTIIGAVNGISISAATDAPSSVTLRGAVEGGTGAGVAFAAGGGAAAENQLTIATGASLGATSGVAVAGGSGNETITNAGTVTGNVLVSGGSNTFINQSTGVFNTGNMIDLSNGDGLPGGNQLANAGRLSPGGDGMIETVTLAGDLELQAGGVFAVDIQSDGTSDRVEVTGETTLGGALNLNGLGLLSAFTDGQDYTIITSADGVAGAFDSLVDNVPDLVAEVTVEPGELGGEFVQVTLVAGMDPEPESLSDKSIHPSVTQAVSADARILNDLLQSRARAAALPQSDSGNSGAVLNFAPARQDLGTVEVEELSFWFVGYGHRSSVDATSNAAEFDSETGGFQLGAEHQVNANARFGLSLGFAQSSIDSDASSADVTNTNLSLYGSWESGPFLATATLGYSWSDYEFARAIPVGTSTVTAEGDADGTSLQFSAAGSWDVAPQLGWDQGGRTRVAPIVRFDHVTVRRDAFSETGAGALNLDVESESLVRNWLSAGISWTTEIDGAEGIKIFPYLEARYERGFGDFGTSVDSSLATVGGAEFTAQGASNERENLGVSAGISVEIEDQLYAQFSYDGTFAEGYDGHRAAVTLVTRF